MTSSIPHRLRTPPPCSLPYRSVYTLQCQHCRNAMATRVHTLRYVEERKGSASTFFSFLFFLQLVSRQADWKIFLKSCPTAGGRSMPLKSPASQRLMLPQVFSNWRTMQSTAYSHHKSRFNNGGEKWAILLPAQ